MKRAPARSISAGIILLVLTFMGLVGSVPAAASDDALFSGQWSLAKIQAEQAWATSRGNDIKVAVLDTGVDFNHEDLAGKAAGSFNCIKNAGIEEPCDPSPGGDDNGHGTQVAGIIGAVEGNGKGIAGVAPGAMIMSFKALGADGSGDLSDVIRAIRSAADNGARVINLSLGPEVNLINDLLNLVLGADPKQEFRDAFAYAADKGALVIAAAGNSGTSSFFSGLENVYVVGSTGPGDEVAFYSSNGAEIFAPGGNSAGLCNVARCVNTTSSGGAYKPVQGTSFAAPHVSGAAALTMAQGLSASQTRVRLNETADPIQAGKRVNAARAVSPNSPAPGPAPQPQAAPPVPAPKPPVLPPALLPVPLPLTQDVVPILVLSSREPEESPPAEKLAARVPESPEAPPWPGYLAAILAVATAVGHSLFRFSRRRWI